MIIVLQAVYQFTCFNRQRLFNVVTQMAITFDLKQIRLSFKFYNIPRICMLSFDTKHDRF